MRKLPRNPFAEPRGKFFRGIVRETRKNDLFELAALLRDCVGNPRIRVAVKIHPPRRNRVNNLTAVGGVQHRSFGFRYMQRRRI